MPTSDAAELEALRLSLEALLAPKVLGQRQIADAASVDQGLVSRLKNGSVKRVTERTRRVARYVDMRLSMVELPSSVVDAVRAYLVGGGDPDLLQEQLTLLRRVRRG